MRLPFEEWTIEKQFSNNVFNLFNEAFICYKNGAYRASLLFSYIAFLTNLKEIIIKSSKPSSITQGKWDKIIRNLQDDENWETTVKDEIINGKNPVFNINENLRQQFKYWKDRRNDCAHFKTNEIEAHHTEAFWSFIKSNLSKFTIEGGKESLLNKFKIHFDPTFTPPNADFSYLVKEINESIEVNELQYFWEDLTEMLDDDFDFFFSKDTNTIKIFNRVFELCNEEIQESLVKFIKDNKYDLAIVSVHPDKVNKLDYNSQEVREIWRKRIWKDKSLAFPVYAALLRNSLIPQEEIDEANYEVLKGAKGYRPENELTHLTLAANGFGDLIFQESIKKNRLKDWYHWVQPRADLHAYYIEKYPLKEETVEVICEMYERENYSYWLDERLERIFKEKPEKKQEFHKIANSKGYRIPDKLR